MLIWERALCRGVLDDARQWRSSGCAPRRGTCWRELRRRGHCRRLANGFDCIMSPERSQLRPIELHHVGDDEARLAPGPLDLGLVVQAPNEKVCPWQPGYAVLFGFNCIIPCTDNGEVSDITKVANVFLLQLACAGLVWIRLGAEVEVGIVSFEN